MLAYGPGDDFKINTDKSFKVYTQFPSRWKPDNEMWGDVMPGDELWPEPEPVEINEIVPNVKVTLTQEGRSVEIYQDCGEWFYS